MLTFSLPAFAVAALLALMTVPASATATPVPPNSDASAMPGNEAEDAIAVNPADPSDIVTMATLPDVPSGLFEGVSLNGGRTWTRQVIGTGGPLGEICCDEQLAWDRFGNLWMTYLVNTNGHVLVAVSTDRGRTFSKVAEVVPTTPTGSRAPAGATPKRMRQPSNNPHISGDQPSISVGPDSVWVSYTSFPSTVVQAFGASVTGLGAFGSFSAPETVPTSAGRGDFGDTAVGPDGQVMVTYQDQTNGQGGSHIYTAVDANGLQPGGFSDPRLLAHSAVGGFDFIPAQPDRSVDAEANLAWDRSGGPHNGRVYAIWTQESPNESDNMDVMLQHSDDNGSTWSAPIRLNDDQTANSQFMPAIAVDQATGNVAVSWYDSRDDLGTRGPGDTDGIPNDDAQIWATYSTDGGATFAPNFRVSAGTFNAPDAQSGFDYGDYTHAAFQSGLFYPAWSDNSDSTGQ
ncbi:MAG: exo-alpha-sialidase, partial [Actinobacteria bacterium]|nr:exo-alpha-sialidase [Actinomycetota bacterium]